MSKNPNSEKKTFDASPFDTHIPALYAANTFLRAPLATGKSI